LGEAYLGATFYDEARQVFLDVLKTHPDHPQALKYIDHLSGEKQRARGQRAMEKGDFEEAVINFEEALELNQKNTRAHMGLASAYLELGELDKTIELIEALYGVERSELDEYVLLVNRLAIHLRKVERYDDAIGVYGIALEADPEDPALYFNLAMSHLKKNEKGHAKIHLRQAIELDPNFQEAKDLLNELSKK
jgi:tetratricopeptide (TPR) repeat protein